MTRFRLPILVLALTLVGGGAHAQGFFERLFGLVPSRPEPPPVYRRAPPPPAPGEPIDGLPPGEDPSARRSSAPVQARPVAIKAPSEESVLGRELKQNGSTGSMRIERSGAADYRIRMTLLGRKAADSPETCSVTLGGSAPLPLVSQGRPEGALRLQLQEPSCPLQIDLLDEAVLVKGSGEVCVFQVAGCQADPSGMWGPDAASLVPRARDFEMIRASADKAARDNYKVMTQRAKPEAVRPIVAEQAAFSADREQVCKSYAREAVHGFCNARFSEGRALSLATRLGIATTASAQVSDAPRSRRTRALADDPYNLPSSDDLMQR
jgi:hypothetical protein